MVRLCGKPIIFQMERMMIVGITGVAELGNKWELSDLDIEYADEEILELTFSTAWSPPRRNL